MGLVQQWLLPLKTILKSSGKNYKEGYGKGEGYWDKHSAH